MGIATYHAYISLKKSNSPRSMGMGLLALFVVGTYLLAYTFRVDRVESSLYLRAFTCGMLILGLGLVPIKIIVNRWMIFMGEISFSVYLGHTTGLFLVINIIQFLYEKFSPLIAFGIGYSLLLAIVVPISYGTFKLVENPGNRAGQRLIAMLRHARARAA
jgi:peptidoglycan/LPS O-acetylase OafA/YrhL